MNALILIEFDPEWKIVISTRWVPLPTQNSCVHRIAVVAEGLPSCDVSVVVTELATSKLWQMKLEHMHLNSLLTQYKYWRGDTLVREFKLLMDQDSKQAALSDEVQLAGGKKIENNLHRAQTSETNELAVEFFRLLQEGPSQARLEADGIIYLKFMDVRCLSVFGFEGDQRLLSY